ncbi:MAG TPA: hypothetical protein GXX28_05555 [Firmicutes bacterium]|nr:hypothetical protein [Bacillota bacterium]
MRRVPLLAVLAGLLLLLGVGPALAAERALGTYLQAAVTSDSFDGVCRSLENAVPASGLQLLASRDLAVKDQRVRVYVLAAPKFTELVAAQAPRWAAAVLPQRLVVYQFAGKVCVNFVNPVALAHVFIGEPVQISAQTRQAILKAAEEVEKDLEGLVRAAGLPVQIKDLEPRRQTKDLSGYNGDGMGKIMARSKNFYESLQVVAEYDGADQAAFDRACRKVEENLGHSKNGWRILSALDTGNLCRVYGVTQPEAEETAIRIESMFRKDKAAGNPLPGVDHAGAFPMEVLVYVDNGKVKVAHFGQMWRMQYYFWDAGYAAFTANVAVPGRIFNQITAAVTGK